jgi:hypothetical protein
MRRNLLALLVLVAIMVGVGAAGTPVNGDTSVAATTAGINLGHPVQAAQRFVVAPIDQVPAILDGWLLLVALASAWYLCDTSAGIPGPQRLLRDEWSSRAPPSRPRL